VKYAVDHRREVQLKLITLGGLDARVERVAEGDLRMRAVVAVLLAVCSTWLFNQPAFAEKRVALVMGNSGYRNVGRLANPANDSEAMSAIFKKAGFDVVDLKRDLSVSEMRHALRDFSDSVRDADIMASRSTATTI
jgi:hypothetical protein